MQLVSYLSLLNFSFTDKFRFFLSELHPLTYFPNLVKQSFYEQLIVDSLDGNLTALYYDSYSFCLNAGSAISMILLATGLVMLVTAVLKFKSKYSHNM